MKYKLLSTILLLFLLLTSVGLFACYFQVGALSIESASQLATIAGAVGGVASLYFIALQLTQQSRLARASNSQSFVSLASDFTSQVINNDALIRIWYDGAAQYPSWDDTRKDKYKQLMGWWLTFYENMLYQHECGLLDHGVYRAWTKDMDYFIKNRNLPHIWSLVKHSYSSSFVQYVDERIKALFPPPDKSAGTPPAGGTGTD